MLKKLKPTLDTNNYYPIQGKKNHYLNGRLFDMQILRVGKDYDKC